MSRDATLLCVSTSHSCSPLYLYKKLLLLQPCRGARIHAAQYHVATVNRIEQEEEDFMSSANQLSCTIVPGLSIVPGL